MTLNKYQRTGAAALGALAVASAANAADMYSGGMKEAPVYVPPPTWTGFYLGGHIGAAWESVGNQNNLFNDDCMGWGIWSGGDSCGKNGTYTAGTAWTYSSAAINERRESSGDAFGGVQFGYNFQTYGAFVWGLEVDLGGMALNGNGNGNGNTLWTDGWGHTHSTPMNFSEDNQGGFYGDVTGRLGYTWGPAMLYVKGGFAFLDADLKSDESIMDSHGIGMCANTMGVAGWCDFSHNGNASLTGYTIGGGLEWKVSPLWSIKVEYLHFDFSNFNNNCCNDWISQQSWGVNNNFDHHADLQIDTVKLGVNYFWSPAYPAPLK